ncbi:UDP-glycosyltransferase 72E1-like [Pyrus x bretschneideri]|uniref:UDP-glycosyltransferase 72E1-like n=1 Tax=Pyrus x bretschneideri TaxID=225117 RepID=UPI00202EBA0D|nr:UDP-glycosyltransferase 72E1-like [Pyrus x bretschneideri]
MESTQNKPHVAVLASPGMGHVTPLLELAKRLVVDHGFHVTFLSITTDAPPAQLQLLSNPSLPSDLHVVSLPSVDVSQQANDVSVRIVLVVQETLKSLPFVLKNLQPPIKSLVFDPFCTIAHDVAADLSIPTYLFLTSSALFLALTMYFPTINAEVNGDHSKIAEEVLVPGCKPLLLDDLIPGVLMPELLLMSNRLPIVNGVLVNTWEELEPVTLHSIRESPFFLGLPAPPVYPIGPLTKEGELVTSALESSKLMTWLDQQPAGSVVYVSFGSGGTLSGKQMSELALGLELSQKRFVWVARPPSEASVSGNFFKASFDADDPASYLPKGFLDRTRGRGLVTSSWAPQVAVLSHQSVAGFVTHCGWNSVLESILHGVVMIAWPLYAEQRMNARFLVDAGVAVWPEAEEDNGKRVVGRCEVERVVRTILDEEGEGLRRRVRELQGTAAKALKVGGPSNGSLHRLAKEWRES